MNCILYLQFPKQAKPCTQALYSALPHSSGGAPSTVKILGTRLKQTLLPLVGGLGLALVMRGWAFGCSGSGGTAAGTDLGLCLDPTEERLLLSLIDIKKQIIYILYTYAALIHILVLCPSENLNPSKILHFLTVGNLNFPLGHVQRL